VPLDRPFCRASGVSDWGMATGIPPSSLMMSEAVPATRSSKPFMSASDFTGALGHDVCRGAGEEGKDLDAVEFLGLVLVDEIQEGHARGLRTRESKGQIHRLRDDEPSRLIAHCKIAMSAVPAMTPSKIFFAASRCFRKGLNLYLTVRSFLDFLWPIFPSGRKERWMQAGSWHR